MDEDIKYYEEKITRNPNEKDSKILELLREAKRIHDECRNK